MSAMTSEQRGFTLEPVMAANAGETVQERRERLGMSVRQLAKEAHVDRSRIDLIEAGETVTPRVLNKVVRTLDRIEHEISGPYDDEDAGVVTFKIRGNFGVDVTLAGPVDNLPELEASVTRLMRSIGEQSTTAE